MATKVIEVNGEYVAKWGLEQFLKERPGTRAFVAIDEEDAVGSLLFTDGYITHIHVSEDYRRGGFGTKLLEYAANVIAKDKTLKAVVGDHNPDAQAFFLKNGFRYAGRSVLNRSSAALMEKRIFIDRGTDHADREVILSTALDAMLQAMYTVEVAPIHVK